MEFPIDEKKSIEDRLLESEAHYRILAENMEDVVWRFDLQTMRFSYVSPSVERLLGYKPEEAQDLSLKDLLTQESHAYFREILPERLGNAHAKQEDWTFIVDIFEHLHKDRSTVWVEISSRIFRRDDGSLEVIGVSRDYSKQKQQQLELATAIKRLEQGKAFVRTVMDTAPCLLCCMDKEGKILYLNSRCVEAFGKDWDSQQQLSLAEFVPPHLYPQHDFLLKECLQGISISFTQEDQLGGRYFYGMYNPFFNSDGEVEKVVVAAMDITQQKQMEQRLVEAQKEATIRLREFAQTIPDLGFIVDEDGRIIELFGQNHLLSTNGEGNLAKSELTDFMSEKTAGKLLFSIKQAIQMATLQFGEYQFHTHKGKRIFEARIAPMSYEIEGKRTVACNAIDITEKKFTQKILQVSYEKKRQKDLLNGLVEGKVSPSQEVLDEAWRVKLNLAQSFSCYVLLVHGWQEQRNEVQFLLDSLIEVLSEQTEGIVWESKDGIVILNPLPVSCEDIKLSEQKIASIFQEIIHNHFPDVVFSIGIAEFHSDTFWKLALVYSQACNAAYLGGNLNPNSQVHHYLDLGVFQIFPSLADKEQVQAYIQRTIGKLLDYDQKKGSRFVATLAKILQNDNLKSVAEELFVHYKTIVFRKKRIEEILGISLDSFETRLTLITALKLRQAFQLKLENINFLVKK